MIKNPYECQKELCEIKGWPLLAPENICPNCGVHIWQYFSLEESEFIHVSSCPKCKREF